MRPSLAQARRILVIGPSGSGKSYLATRLAPLLGLPLVHLDLRFWQPGWVPTPQAEWRQVVARLVCRPRWIMDGLYESTLDLRLPACDSVILTESRRLPCLLRVVYRKLASLRRARLDAPPGQRIDGAFLSYIWRYPSVVRPLVDRCLEEYARGKGLVVVQGASGIRRLLEGIQAQDRAPAP